MASVSGAQRRLSRWMQGLTGAMDLPKEVVLDVLRATMIGAVQVQIENHRGLLEYRPDRLRVRTRDGELIIVGSQLKVGSIFKDELVVEGRIRSVSIDDARSQEAPPP